MNQYVAFNFAIKKDERVYILQLLPGSPWEEIDAVLDEFKVEVQRLKEQALKAEEEKKNNTQPVEAQVVNQPDVSTPVN